MVWRSNHSNEPPWNFLTKNLYLALVLHSWHVNPLLSSATGVVFLIAAMVLNNMHIPLLCLIAAMVLNKRQTKELWDAFVSRKRLINYAMTKEPEFYLGSYAPISGCCSISNTLLHLCLASQNNCSFTLYYSMQNITTKNPCESSVFTSIILHCMLFL